MMGMMKQAVSRPGAMLARRVTLAGSALLAFTVMSVSAVLSSGAALAAEPQRPVLSSIELGGSVLPHGIVGADGAEPTVWFSAARRSAIGEIDVATRSVGYIALGHGARPRALTRCPNGKLYALDPALNVIHEITSATEEVVRHPMPDGHTADLSGATCTAGNLLVFTGYNGWVGTLDTASGKVSLSEAVTGRGPASIALSSGGAVWFAAYASNQIVRVDPVSMRQDAFAMPTGVEGPKGMVVDSTGRVWVTAYRSGRIARFDPRRRSWDAWSLGEGARPFALTLDAAGTVIVSDVGRDKLVRFDAATGSGTVIASLSERGQARAVTRLGDQIWISETAVDRIRIIDTSVPPSN